MEKMIALLESVEAALHEAEMALSQVDLEKLSEVTASCKALQERHHALASSFMEKRNKLYWALEVMVRGTKPTMQAEEITFTVGKLGVRMNVGDGFKVLAPGDRFWTTYAGIRPVRDFEEYFWSLCREMLAYLSKSLATEPKGLSDKITNLSALARGALALERKVP